MLTSLFPNTHTRYTSLPVLGAFLEDLCSWLKAPGYVRRTHFSADGSRPVSRKMFAGATNHVAVRLHAERLRACLPRQRRWTPQIAPSADLY